MEEPTITELWPQFNMGEKEPDPGGGILYALRYDSSSLSEHQAKVVDNLVQSGVKLYQHEGYLIIDLLDCDEASLGTLGIMVEELSVTNEGLAYSKSGIGPCSIEEFTNQMKKAFYVGRINKSSELPDLFDFVDSAIPEVVSGMQFANAQNEALSPDEVENIRVLGKFAANQADILSMGDVIFFGTN